MVGVAGSLHDAAGEVIRTLQQPFEGYGTRERRVIKEQGDRSTTGQCTPVRAPRVNSLRADLDPTTLTAQAEPDSLGGGQDGEADPMIRQEL